jgi:hypothetical protein
MDYLRRELVKQFMHCGGSSQRYIALLQEIRMILGSGEINGTSRDSS